MQVERPSQPQTGCLPDSMDLGAVARRACLTAAGLVLSAAACAAAPAADAGSAGDAVAPPVIDPQIERRDVTVPRIPSRNVELGTFAGSYHTQNFGSAVVAGVRAGYHITQDFFSEIAVAQTRVSDDNYRQILPGGLFPTPSQTLRYYDISVGYNVLPGEVFPFRHSAKVSTLYLIGGAGVTQFVGVTHQTVNLGAGLRVFLADWFAVQADAREHFFSLNLLGRPQTSDNAELTLGVTFFF